MKYWKEATREEFDEAESRAKDTRTGKLYMVAKMGELKEVMKDFLENIK